MKPTNPMAKLEQWKANNAPKIGSVKNSHTLKFEDSPKTQQEAQGATKDKRQGKLPFNPLVVEYSQITRQFKLIHDSNRKCLEVYPDDFHHKLKMREECADLASRLKRWWKVI